MKWLWFSAAIVLALLSAHYDSEAQQPGEVSIDGIVMDGERKPLPGVTVMIISIGKKGPVRSVVTNKEGRYSFKIRVETPYDLWYTHTKFDPDIASHLADEKNQHINKILYPVGTKRPVAAIQEALQSYERMLLYAMSINKDDRSEAIQLITRSGMGGVQGLPTGSPGAPEDLILYFENKKNQIRTIWSQLR